MSTASGPQPIAPFVFPGYTPIRTPQDLFLQALLNIMHDKRQDDAHARLARAVYLLVAMADRPGQLWPAVDWINDEWYRLSEEHSGAKPAAAAPHQAAPDSPLRTKGRVMAFRPRPVEGA